MKKFLSVFLSAVIVFLCFAACGKDTGEDKNIVFPIDNDPVYLDPQIATDKGARDIINNCFEGLVRLGENGEVLPAVAEKWTVSDDGKTYIFSLRKDAMWYFPKTAAQLMDEEKKEGYEYPVFAEDFVFALRRAVDKSTGAKDAPSLFSIKNASKINRGELSAKKLGVYKTDGGELKIVLEKRDDEFLKTLTKALCMPCHEKFFNKTKGRYGLSIQYIIGNGPFYMGSWVEEKSITIKRNPCYNGDFNAAPQSVFFSINNELSSRAKKLTAGTYDISPLDYDGYVQVREEKGCSFLESENTVWSLIFNCKDEYMKDMNTRLAVLYGFDTSLMTQGENMSERAKRIVPESVLSLKNKNKISSVSYNSAKAEKYWEKALSSLNISGMSITIKCSVRNENEIRAVLQNLQKAFGITCDVRVSALEETELMKAVQAGDYQIAYAPIKAPSDSAVDYLEYAAGLAFYDNGELKSVIKRIRKAGEEDKQKGILHAEEQLVNNAVIIPVFSAKSYLAMRKGISGVYTDFSQNVISFFNTYKFD